MDKMIDITEAAELLGVVTKTLRRWDDTGKLKAVRTFGNHRRYRVEDIEAIINSLETKAYQSTRKKVFIYCRVSTKKQKEAGNLQRQRERLIQHCSDKQYNVIHVFKDIASGLNDNRRELIKMLGRLNEVDSIIVEYSDRLARFGFNYLLQYAKSFNVEIETVEKNEKLEPNEEMVNDLVSVVTCFSERMYGARGGRKIKADIEKSLKELENERDEKSEDNFKSLSDK
jgi:excisionase family DNA binding protein